MREAGDTCYEKDESCKEGGHSGKKLLGILKTPTKANLFKISRIPKAIFRIKKPLRFIPDGVK